VITADYLSMNSISKLISPVGLLVASTVFCEWYRRSEVVQTVIDDKDEHDIERVLSFWFQGDYQELYSTRWFPASGSVNVEKQSDGRVVTEFGQLVEKAEANQLAHWAGSTRGSIALVLLLDQLARHVHRYEQLPADHLRRADADTKALQIVKVISPVPSFFSFLLLSRAPSISSTFMLRIFHTYTFWELELN
jgi:hypothetical protein